MRDQYSIDNPSEVTSVNRVDSVNPQNQAQNPGSVGTVQSDPNTPVNPQNQAQNPGLVGNSPMNEQEQPNILKTVKTSAGEQVIGHDELKMALNKDRTYS